MEKEVDIDGKRIPFKTMKNDSVMTENRELGLIGYSRIYYIDGVKNESQTPLKFYR
jgi:hypothetical protein